MNNKDRLSAIFDRSVSFRDNIMLQKIALAAALFLAIYLLLIISSMPARLDLSIGRPSPKTIYASRDTIDEYTTNRLRESAADSVSSVYNDNPAVLENALEQIDQFFEAVFEIKADEEAEYDDKIYALQELTEEELPESTLEALLIEQATLLSMQRRLSSVVTEIFQQGIREEDLQSTRRRVTQEIALLPFNSELKRIAEQLVLPMVEPNRFLDVAATEAMREQARQEVEPVIVLRNTLIVSEGEPVTAQQMALLESMGLLRGRQADYFGYVGLFFLLLIVFIVVTIYIRIFVNHVFRSPPYLTLMGLVVIITLVFAIAATYFSGYLIPVAIGVILLTVLFGYKLAVIINLVFALFVGLITSGDFAFVIVAMLGGMVSIYAVSTLSQRSDLARAGFFVAVTNAGVIVSIFFFFGNVSLETDSLVSLGYSVLAGIGSGIFSSVIAIGLLPYLETFFGVTTAITLLELSNPNHPLLKEMLQKAPGTYYHSMMVSNLAESAAESVKADALLTRVGAYYHDIGKLKRPYFFSENQLSGDNPHSKLSPNLSSLIIGAHPKDGFEMGKKHKLPEAILDITSQHHGTSMISFFYQQALENCEHEEVPMEKFRYEGPKPQTKEAAIIMLADVVEAGVRSLSKPAGGRVETMIRRMIKEKVDDGQLDECDLTFKEIDLIAQSFVYIMSGIYHSRIEYPEKDLKAELERSSSDR